MQLDQKRKLTPIIKTENAQSMPCSTRTAKSLSSILTMQKNRGFLTRSEHSLIGPTDGLVKMAVKPESAGGFKPGKHGCVKMSTGKWLEIEIIKNEGGIATVPPLRGRDWRLIDGEIDGEKYDNPRFAIIEPEDELYWAGVLLQGSAALKPSPFEHILTRITRLKLQKPTQKMDENAVSVFLEDICEHLERRGYCYYAIDKGMMNLIEQEEDKFFPTMKTLLKYIHPLHWKLQQRIEKIEEILKRMK